MQLIYSRLVQPALKARGIYSRVLNKGTNFSQRLYLNFAVAKRDGKFQSGSKFIYTKIKLHGRLLGQQAEA